MGGSEIKTEPQDTKYEPGAVKSQNSVFTASNYQTLAKLEPLQPEEGATNWWEEEKTSPKNPLIKWKTLRHNGVLFPPPYEPHGVSPLVKSKPLKLTPGQEEPATYFASLYERDSYKDKVFRKNFLNDWKKLFNGKSKKDLKVLKDLKFAEMDFKPIFDHLQKEKEKLAELRKTVEFKEKRKKENKEKQEIYGFAIVDGRKQRVGIISVEMPGLFMGRGSHPRRGSIKERVMPEDVILNIGKGEKIPNPHVPGHNWGGVTHNQNSIAIGRARSQIENGWKYFNLDKSSDIKAQSDREKYENARSLKNKIGYVRSQYTKELTSVDEKKSQKATAIYIIDRLAIRVGTEKDTKKTADTVGVNTLRVEHLKFEKDGKITLDFLGKDSIRYLNTVKVDAAVYKNLRKFCRYKAKRDLIFDKLSTRIINQYLNSLCKNLSAKVFRTFNASFTLQLELDKRKLPMDDTLDKKKFFYDNANRQVAVLCNHQKAVSKTFEQTMGNIEKRLVEMENQLKGLKKEFATVKKATKGEKTKCAKSKVEKAKNKVERKSLQIEKTKLQIELKSSTKQIALGTSKMNYMDPRITVVWCKKNEMPIEKIFPKRLLNLFPWALSVDPQFAF